MKSVFILFATTILSSGFAFAEEPMSTNDKLEAIYDKISSDLKPQVQVESENTYSGYAYDLGKVHQHITRDENLIDYGRINTILSDIIQTVDNQSEAISGLKISVKSNVANKDNLIHTPFYNFKFSFEGNVTPGYLETLDVVSVKAEAGFNRRPSVLTAVTFSLTDYFFINTTIQLNSLKFLKSVLSVTRTLEACKSEAFQQEVKEFDLESTEEIVKIVTDSCAVAEIINKATSFNASLEKTAPLIKRINKNLTQSIKDEIDTASASGVAAATAWLWDINVKADQCVVPVVGFSIPEKFCTPGYKIDLSGNAIAADGEALIAINSNGITLNSEFSFNEAAASQVDFTDAERAESLADYYTTIKTLEMAPEEVVRGFVQEVAEEINIDEFFKAIEEALTDI